MQFILTFIFISITTIVFSQTLNDFYTETNNPEFLYYTIKQNDKIIDNIKYNIQKNQDFIIISQFYNVKIDNMEVYKIESTFKNNVQINDIYYAKNGLIKVLYLDQIISIEKIITFVIEKT